MTTCMIDTSTLNSIQCMTYAIKRKRPYGYEEVRSSKIKEKEREAISTILLNRFAPNPQNELDFHGSRLSVCIITFGIAI